MDMMVPLDYCLFLRPSTASILQISNMHATHPRSPYIPRLPAKVLLWYKSEEGRRNKESAVLQGLSIATKDEYGAISSVQFKATLLNWKGPCTGL
jgi:hypothetical protein